MIKPKLSNSKSRNARGIPQDGIRFLMGIWLIIRGKMYLFTYPLPAREGGTSNFYIFATLDRG
jgi:hypothetical protein